MQKNFQKYKKKNMKNLVFDCYNGVSEDMIVGVLLDLGADEKLLKKAIKCLNLSNFDIKIQKILKNSIFCTDFDVQLKAENPDHDMEYLYGQKQVEVKIEEKHNLTIINKMIEKSILSKRAKEIALNIFNLIALAEGKTHGVDPSEVIFHESGAMDSIIDIVSIATCVDSLDVDNIYVKNLREEQGYINTRVGRLTIPTPAVKNVLEIYNKEIQSCSLPYELITPTGISAIATLTNFNEPPKNYSPISTGFGSGKRNYT